MMDPRWFALSQLGGMMPPQEVSMDQQLPVFGPVTDAPEEEEDDLTFMQKLARASGEGPTSEWATRYSSPNETVDSLPRLLALIRTSQQRERRPRGQPIDFATFMKQNNLRGLLGG